jgi:hypothetical protein
MTETQSSYKELLAKWADKYRGVGCAQLVSIPVDYVLTLLCIGDRGRPRPPSGPFDAINFAHLDRTYDCI